MLVDCNSFDIAFLFKVEGNVFVVYNLGINDHPLGDISVKVNDNEYHVVRFTRTGPNSTLQIDDYNVQTTYPMGKYLLLNVPKQTGSH